jgi:cyclase
VHKVRIVPTLLTDGNTLVKGQEFNSWRSVGSVAAAARLFAMRDVDELMLLDVAATRQGRLISGGVIEDFASVLRVPFSVGGGVNSIEGVRSYLRAGAEKVVLGTAALENPNLVEEAASQFGSQAIIASIDVISISKGTLAIRSGQTPLKKDLIKTVIDLEKRGIGEILVQSVTHDGKMEGMNFEAIKIVSEAVGVPVIASSGAGSHEDFLTAIRSGASAVAAGAIFQFSQVTPRSVRTFLHEQGISVRTQ